MPLYARGNDGSWQLLSEHLENVAKLAGNFAEDFRAREWGQAVGLLHDRGKASRDFQERLQGSNRRVDHSTAGAQFADAAWKGMGRLIAACIAGHHGGLKDGASGGGSSLAERLRKTVPRITNESELPAPSAPGTLPIKSEPGQKSRLAFQISFFTRMIFSCLTDADFLDTESFMDRDKSSARRGYPELSQLQNRFSGRIDLIRKKSNQTPIDLQRNRILDACLASADQPSGLFSLTVPTGGGKTLSSLAFALKHALNHGLTRIIYVIPFTSIIEQNADVFRQFVGHDSVLEHHSAFDTAKLAGEDPENSEILRRFELASENWDAPLVVTTSVQFFESLFSSKTSKCRKLHNIAKSVVILDEAQMLPVEYLRPCLEALRELAANYGTSIVLCTATQPALTRNDEFSDGLEGVKEIAPDPKQLYESFKRVKITYAGVLPPDRLIDSLGAHSQVLCIVNTRKEAREVFEGLRSVEGTFHLSALMCPEHRSIRIAEIKERLRRGLPCRVVSTQLIEAGVDIDFPVVYRAIAGIDSIAQAAGRCNREGRLLWGKVVLFQFETGMPSGPFRIPAEVAAETMRKHPDDPLCLDAVEDFFRNLYWRAGEQLDSEHILDDLQEGLRDCYFPFETVARKFRIIKKEGETLIVPFDEKARKAIDRLRYAEFPGKILRDLQRYTVQVYPHELTALETSGAIELIQGIYPVLNSFGHDRRYREDVGLALAKSENASELWMA
ncbi:MAG: CRISPR-associated helicase Cas3' [Syntrophobacter sp.]